MSKFTQADLDKIGDLQALLIQHCPHRKAEDKPQAFALVYTDRDNQTALVHTRTTARASDQVSGLLEAALAAAADHLQTHGIAKHDCENVLVRREPNWLSIGWVNDRGTPVWRWESRA